MADDAKSVAPIQAPNSLERVDKPGAKAADAGRNVEAHQLLKDANVLAAEGDYLAAVDLLAEALRLSPKDSRIQRDFIATAQQMAGLIAEGGPSASNGSAVPKVRLGDSRVSRSAGRDSAAPAPWPGRRIAWQDTERLFRKYILSETVPEPGLISITTPIVTMGSCFAENISKALLARGAVVHYHRLKEDLNTTHANERIVRWALEGPLGPDGEALEAAFGPASREAVRRELQTCAVYIFSLGVAPAFFNATGQFVLRLGGQKVRVGGETSEFRTTGPRENADNVRSIIRMLRAANPDIQIFLTLSPAPLLATFERGSAVIADCLSKSSLRLAIEDVMADGIDGVRYWPSFEMAKWWGAHLQDGRAFAEDDAQSRHVSSWLVDQIIALFVEYFGDETLSVPATAGGGGAP